MNALVVNQCHHIHIATMNFTGFNGFPLSPLDAVYVVFSYSVLSGNAV